ncbi:hypothetical protein ACTU45_35485, partial [Streptomyces sp. 24-1644]
MTDSAGTPADPDQPGHQAEDEPQAGAHDGSGATTPQDGPRAPGSGSGSEPEPETEPKVEAGAGAESGSGSEPEAGGESKTATGGVAAPAAGGEARPGDGGEAAPAAHPESGSATASGGVQTWSQRPKDGLTPAYKRH